LCPETVVCVKKILAKDDHPKGRESGDSASGFCVSVTALSSGKAGKLALQ